MKKSLLARLRSGGFTMIELLIVIAILGILAVLVLSAINPLEQINRGRDTAKRSDAEQLLSAVERYNAFQTTYPWRTDGSDTTEISTIDQVTDAYPIDDSGCAMMDKLAQGSTGAVTCVGTEELKASYLDRITNFAEARGLYIVNEDSDDTAMNTYVCFSPESNAFEQEATQRCAGGAPSDLTGSWASICNTGGTGNAAGEDKPMVCLP